MATYYVETVRIPFGCGGKTPGHKRCVKVDFLVKKAADWSIDTVSPDMTAVFRVDGVTNATEAVSCIMEYAAGLTPSVSLVLGGRKPVSFLGGR